MRVDRFALSGTLALSAVFLLSPAYAGPSGTSLWAAPVVSRGTCTFKTTEIAASASYDESASTSFVSLKDAGSITFVQARTGCVAGTFFANAGNETDHVLLQVLLDGTACAPLTGDYIFANSGPDFSSHSVRFFCGAQIVPGKHVIQVQFASGVGGNSQLFQRTLEVTHE